MDRVWPEADQRLSILPELIHAVMDRACAGAICPEEGCPGCMLSEQVEVTYEEKVEVVKLLLGAKYEEFFDE